MDLGLLYIKHEVVLCDAGNLRLGELLDQPQVLHDLVPRAPGGSGVRLEHGLDRLQWQIGFASFLHLPEVRGEVVPVVLAVALDGACEPGAEDRYDHPRVVAGFLPDQAAAPTVDADCVDEKVAFGLCTTATEMGSLLLDESQDFVRQEFPRSFPGPFWPTPNAMDGSFGKDRS
ncbi:hypothetical protein GP486_005456 [Trichoglossum hirsutum]|uniref:Uncharacterized protein n=1 Tax=Trichoglossum hirsutum TaxID=265104 RepID=A0A9P8RM78_9PEZI|nr:hypothetical protein GP486_005456 [Trichoglossum hirsutum]